MTKTLTVLALCLFATSVMAVFASDTDAVFYWDFKHIKEFSGLPKIAELEMDQVPTGVVVDPSGDVVVRHSSGLDVFGYDGKLKRNLSSYSGRGFVAPLRSGWVASTLGSDISAYAIDGHAKIRIDDFAFPLGVKSLTGGWLAVNARDALRLYSGWPPRLNRTLQVGEDITAVMLLDEKRMVVAAAANADDNAFPRKVPGTVDLYEYDIPGFALLAKTSLGVAGYVNEMRRVGDVLAVDVIECDTTGSVFLRFVNLDLSKSVQPDFPLEGPAALATSNGHLLVAERPCGGSDGGRLLDYDPVRNSAKSIVNGPYIVMEADGS